MFTDTETYQDEQLTDLEPEPMSTSEFEGVHEYDQAHAESREEYPVETHVSDVRGGERELWNVEFAGEGNYRFEDGQIINNETGESLAAEIERTHGAEEAAVIEEGQRLLSDGGTSTIRTPMYVEDGPDKTTFYDTQYIINKDGRVGYEIRSYSIAKRENDEPALSYEQPHETETHERRGFAEMLTPETESSEEGTGPEIAIAAYAEEDTGAEVEIPETYGHPQTQEIELRISPIAEEGVADDQLRVEPDVPQREERADNWLLAFFDREPLEFNESEVPEKTPLETAPARAEDDESVALVARRAGTEQHVTADIRERLEELHIPEGRVAKEGAIEDRRTVDVPDIRNTRTEPSAASAVVQKAFVPETRPGMDPEHIASRPETQEKKAPPKLESVDAEKSIVTRRDQITRAEVKEAGAKTGATESSAQRLEGKVIRATTTWTEKRGDRKVEAKQEAAVRESREQTHRTGENLFGIQERTFAPRAEVPSRAFERDRSARIESIRVQSPELLRRLGVSQSGNPLPAEDIATTRRTSMLSRNGITLRKAA